MENLNGKIKILYKIILILLILLFCITLVIEKYSKKEFVFVSNPVSYNSSIDAIQIPMQEIKTEDKILKQDLEISFNFILDQIAEHDNIFQTSDVNEGIRLEFDKATGNLYLVAKIPPSGSAGYIIKKINPGENNSFKLEKRKNKKLIITLNNEQIPLDYTNDSYKTDNIFVGRGFSPDRKFYGTINDFTVKFSVETINKKWKNIAYFQLLIFFLICLVIAIYNDFFKD